MIIDCHTHIFPAAVRQNRENYFRGEPAFELLYAAPKARLVGAGELVAAMDAQGVDRSVVFGFPWRDARTARLNNDYVLDAVGRYPGRLVGLCCLDPFSPQAEAETRRCLDAGLSGIGELAFYQSGIDAAALDKMAPLMALCLAKGLIAMIHTNEPVGHLYPGKTPNTLRQIYDLVRRFPENKIVLAHWGGGLFFYQLLKKEVKASLQNVY
ncbi:MAG: amidohydrolase family protein, partial [Desulfobacteraceae bacterium]